jgi:hypothetical protein
VRYWQEPVQPKERGMSAGTMDDAQADMFAHAIAGGIAAAVTPLKEELADLEVRVSNLEQMRTGGKDPRNTNLDPAYVARVMEAYGNPADKPDPPIAPEPRAHEVTFTKGMMKGPQVWVARAVLPNQEGVITYKIADQPGDLPSIILELPSGDKIKYVPAYPKVEG